MNRTTCKYCKYYHALTSQCRRYPPKLVVVSSTVQPPLKDVFVNVSSDSFCGEFAPVTQ